MSAPLKDRSHWPQAKLKSFDEVRSYRIKQWQDAGCAARLQAAWELVEDYWVGMKGMNPDELRLPKIFYKSSQKRKLNTSSSAPTPS